MTKGSLAACRYPKVAQIEAFAAAAPPGEQRPGILCEYAHSMGNSTGATASRKDLMCSRHVLPGTETQIRDQSPCLHSPVAAHREGCATGA